MEPYNYDTFRRHMFKEDIHFHEGPEPGQSVPDFDLPTIAGSRVRFKRFSRKETRPH